jgi:valyl-tRNA synthetase
MTAIAEPLPTRFDFGPVQQRIYRTWREQGLFRSRTDARRKPYTIVIPPPNVTGALHLGHALNNTLQDVLIRWKRMQGCNALWIPGTDHAGIATQAVVEKRIREEENKSRHDLGRAALVERIWQWKDQYESRILSQLQQLGCSCDWDRTRFTLDEMCTRAVRYTFFDLFQKGLIYRGKRLVNWDTFLQTAVSDDEVNNEKVGGHFWHLKYPVIDPRPGEPEFVIVATTRPETMLGDTAVAVHPDPAAALHKVEAELRQRLAGASPSERGSLESELEQLATRRATMLQQLILLANMARDGRKLRLPIVDRVIPLILDQWPKPELGSGCVKITPAHDPNDYEVGMRHGLAQINILNPDGTLNEIAGPYQALTLKKGRQQIVQRLEDDGLIDRVEEREIELPVSDRSKTPIEPYLADQWFVKMDRLAQSAMDAVGDGRVEIVPPRYAHGYLAWLSEKRDWPVSRQLWWGHQIPVWSKSFAAAADLREARRQVEGLLAAAPDRAAIQVQANSIHVCLRDDADASPAALEQMGFQRDPDVLDTWFSSALWPHSTLGWPEATADLAYYYPTSTLVTSRDIITLWVARMVLMGLNNLGQVPFRQVFVHPKILDGYGETMSKSKGNGVDPLDVIEKFGADALRYGMVHLTTDTQDIRLPVQFECPHCQASIDQTHKNRVLPRIECPACKKPFATQWAREAADLLLPRGLALSERFEVARNFVNKLWNASRFALMHLDGYSFTPVGDAQLCLEDRWILSRLSTVTREVTEELERFRFSEAARRLYEFAWDEFCSFYLEFLKSRMNGEHQPLAQTLLAHTLDQLLRLLHPIMPFVTEEIWRHLNDSAPRRGIDTPQVPETYLITAAWPTPDAARHDAAIEAQFGHFQQALAGLREIRARQNIAPKDSIGFVLRCRPDIAAYLAPLTPHFGRMANAEARQVGPNVSIPPIHATVRAPELEIFVDLDGLLDVAAETARLEKEKANLHNQIRGKQQKLSNQNFVDRAPPDVVAKERQTLQLLQEQLAAVDKSLEVLARGK